MILLALVYMIPIGLLFWGFLALVSYFEKNNKEGTTTIIDGEPFILGEESKSPMSEPSVVIKQPKFDTSRIQSYQGDSLGKFEFRPQTWNQFIGQEEAKERAKTIIKKVKRGMKAHVFVNGIRGHGKTTYIELLAKSLDAEFIETVGKQIDEDSLVNIINQINTSKKKYVVWFVDEIETVDWKIIKLLNPIIESFKVNGKKIKPFIFAGATINKHILQKKNPDALDRIPHHITFVRYNKEEISKILRQYKEQLHPLDNVSEETILKIAENCKYNPRTSLALLDDFIVEQNITKILKNWRIVKNGLNNVDIQILQTLNNATRTMGANAIAGSVGLSEKDYMAEYEPYLFEYKFINRVPSRIITEKGKKLLEEM